MPMSTRLHAAMQRHWDSIRFRNEDLYRLHLQGRSVKEIANHFDLSRSSVWKILKRLRTEKAARQPSPGQMELEVTA